MRIWWIKNSRIYQGTPVEIVRQMQFQDTQQRSAPLGDYVTFLIQQASSKDIELRVSGDTEEQRATRLIAAMLSAGLVRAVGVR